MKKCERCDELIIGAEIVQLQGQCFHRECFDKYEAEYRELAKRGAITGLCDNANLRARIADLLPQRRSNIRHTVVFPTYTLTVPAFAVYCWQRFLGALQPRDRLVITSGEWEWWRSAVSGAVTTLKISYVDYPDEFEDDAFVMRVAQALSHSVGVQFILVISPQIIKKIYWDTEVCGWVSRSDVVEGRYGA